MFQADFVSFTLNFEAYKNALLKYLREINRKAGQAWLHTAVDATPIPTWSGASRATFQKLASELGTTVPIGPIVAPKSRVALGRSASAGSGVEENKSTPYVGFVYATNLQYLAYNEYNRAVPGPYPQPYSNRVRFTPYRFQIKALAAWEVEASKARLPNPYDYLSQRKI